MATVRLENAAAWDGYRGHVHVEFEDGAAPVTPGFRAGDVIRFIYANASTRRATVTVYREPQHTVVGAPITIAPNTPETTVAAPNGFNMVQDADGSWAYDPRWSWGVTTSG